MITTTQYETFPALVLSNDVIELTVLQRGASMVRIVLRDDASKLSPLWNPQQVAREHGEPKSSVFPLSPGMGHFVCVDGFGPASEDEQRAGMPMHGEAHQQMFAVEEHAAVAGRTSLMLNTELPLVHERLTRTISVENGSCVVSVDSELESLLAFDRPIVWAEHATVAAPFLEREKTGSDMPAAKSMTRPYSSPDNPPHRLTSGDEFAWPMAPTLDGSLVDLRCPGDDASGDHTGHLMDESRETAFITFTHPERKMMLGYLFRRDEFPFVQNWEYYPASGQLARGLEFSTQPWDCPRREAFDSQTFFGARTYRWLPAKGKISSRFLMFWTRVPAGFGAVSDVVLDAGAVKITSETAGSFRLSTSFSL